MNLPELLVTVNDDLVDLTLGLAQFRLNQDLSSDLVAAATWDSQPIRIGATLGAEWEEQSFDNEGPSALWGTITFLRTGDDSDRFVQTLAEVYDLEADAPKMADKVEFTAAAVGGHPHHPDQDNLHLKLFFNADDEERYAEMYCILDHKKRKLELREADPDFREALLLAFTGD